MTLSEKIATVSKLERIDSSIESCIKILREELNNRKSLPTGWEVYTCHMIESLDRFEDDFNVMKGKK